MLLRAIAPWCVLTVWLFAAGLPAFSQAAPGAAPGAALDVVLALDNSGSMKKNDPNALMPKAVSEFASRLSAKSRFGIILFDQNARVTLELTEAGTPEFQSRVAESLHSLDYSGRLTDIPAGAERSIYSLRNSRPEVQKVVVLFTDGIVETGNPQKDLERSRWVRENLVQEAKNKGIHIFGVALTEAADFELMQSLAQATGGDYFRVVVAADIPATFEQINARLASLGAAAPQSAMPPQTAPLPPVIVQHDLHWEFAVGGAILLAALALMFSIWSRIRRRRTQKPTVKAHLCDVNDSSQNAVHPLNKVIMKIGRDETSNDIVVPKNTISLNHAAIEFRDGAFYLRDLRSTNGTFLNGKKISHSDAIREVVLKHGDKIHLDSFQFEFVEDRLEGVQQTAFARGEELDSLLQAGVNSSAPMNASMCPDHPSWKATEICPVCRVPKCKNCMTQRDGHLVCTSCMAMFKTATKV